MRNFFFTLTLIVLFVRSTGSGSCLTCLVNDSTPHDTAKYALLYKEIATPVIDSMIFDVRAQLRESKKKQDSLSVVVDSVYQERNKHEETLRVDSWPTVEGKINTWFWRFYIYPNGDTIYYRTIKKQQ